MLLLRFGSPISSDLHFYMLGNIRTRLINVFPTWKAEGTTEGNPFNPNILLIRIIYCLLIYCLPVEALTDERRAAAPDVRRDTDVKTTVGLIYPPEVVPTNLPEVSRLSFKAASRSR